VDGVAEEEVLRQPVAHRRPRGRHRWPRLHRHPGGLLCSRLHKTRELAVVTWLCDVSCYVAAMQWSHARSRISLNIEIYADSRANSPSTWRHAIPVLDPLPQLSDRRSTVRKRCNGPHCNMGDFRGSF
jgi:hypothetical protein